MPPITLSNPGERKVRMDAEKARVLVQTWSRILEADPDNYIEELHLHGRSYSLPATTILCDFLRGRVSLVRVALLDDIIASLMTDEGLAVLQMFSELLAESTELQHLNLSDNAMGSRGVEKCQAVLQLPSLRRLELENDGIPAESMEDFLNALQCTDVLEELRLYNNMLGVAGGIAMGQVLRKCRKLRIFRYEGCRPQPKGTKALMEGLLEMSNHWTGLEELWLESSLLSNLDGPLGIFIEALPRFTNLRCLRLFDCGLEPEGCIVVMQNLLHLQGTLQVLDISQNEMTADVIPYLEPILENNPIRSLNLESNELTSLGVERLLRFNLQQLEELELGNNQIGLRGGQALLDATNLGNLQRLGLDENGFPERTMEGLQEKFGAILRAIENVEDADFDDDIEEDDDNEAEEEEEHGGEEEQDAAVDALAGEVGRVQLTPDDVSV
jgi:Ran GTPase-activating protein (RanGAP) involved in mRNA processing and transport